jgi:hypothetical protein
MQFGDLRWGELVGLIGALLLAVGVFLPWYSTGNENSNITDDCRGADLSCSAWEVEPVLRFLLLLTAIAPFILAWIIVRQHKLSWPRGELTAVIGITAVTLILVRGFVFKPGEPSGQISLDFGYFVSLVGAAMILLGAVVRTGEIGGRKRKPPGVI